MIETSIPTGGPFYEVAQRLLDSALEYWTFYQSTLGHHAVVYLKGDDGRVVILTRGEYTEELMENIENVQERSFTEPNRG